MRESRTRDERIRRGDLASAVGDAEALAATAEVAASRVAHVRAELATATAQRDLLLERGATVAVVAHADHYLQRLRRALADARDEQLRAEARHRGQLDAFDAARGRLMIARAEREVIERHFAAWRAQRRKLAERRED
jgi:hypothetical protein